MIARESAAAELRKSLNDLRRAASLWDAADLPSVDRCRKELECAVENMFSAEQMLRYEEGSRTANLRLDAVALKVETVRIQRLVDASSAFLRNAFPDIAGGNSFYNCGGIAPLQAVPSAYPGVQG